MAHFLFAAARPKVRCEGPSSAKPLLVGLTSREQSKALAEIRGWSIARAQGYIDGVIFRRHAKAPLRYAWFGIDDYAVGFQAGYFVRRSPDLWLCEH